MWLRVQKTSDAATLPYCTQEINVKNDFKGERRLTVEGKKHVKLPTSFTEGRTIDGRG